MFQFQHDATVHGEDVLSHTNWEVGERWLVRYSCVPAAPPRSSQRPLTACVQDARGPARAGRDEPMAARARRPRAHARGHRALGELAPVGWDAPTVRSTGAGTRRADSRVERIQYMRCDARVHHDAFLTPGSSLRRAARRKWYCDAVSIPPCRLLASWRTHPRERKLADDTPTAAALVAAVLDRGRARVLVERVELELGLVADLRGQALVPRDVQVRAPQDLRALHDVPRLEVAQEPDVRHGGDRVRVGGRTRATPLRC
jgi:hypothetical protein